MNIDVHIQIERIINRSRFGDEAFFTDTKRAAIDILDYLEHEDLIKKEAVVIEMPQTVGNVLTV